MNDKELLELAAKAAGINIHSWSEIENGYRREDGGYFRPLTDDGDALRLAVKLNLGISIPIHKTIKADVICFQNVSVNIRETGSDPYAATRRAIVLAAAEIGRMM